MQEVFAPPHASIRDSHTTLSTAVTFIACASFLFAIWATFVGFHHSIYDFHGFRQTQTAITVEDMEHGGPFLRYLIPVLGPPWSITFEFPIYQKIVALLVEHLHTPINETGRAVSIAFFCLCFLPLASILKRLRYTRVQILAVLSLLAVSPLYIFVSRMFMIESIALFLALMYVDMIFGLVSTPNPWRYRYMCLAALFGSLAGAVKVTTYFPCLLLGSGIGLWQLWVQRRKLSLYRTALVIFLAGLVPAAATVCWTEFASHVRAQNPFGAPYLNGRGWEAWNFGTLAQRLRPSNYMHFIHAVPSQAGSFPLLVLLVVVYALLLRRWNVVALVSLALFLITTMTFFHLHLVHAYYPYSCVIFLLVSAGVLIADLLSLPGRRAWLGFGFLTALIIACLVHYRQGFYRIQQWNAPGRPEAAAIIDRTTKPSDVIVTFGLSWSPELPYQSHRRAISNLVGGSPIFPNSADPLAVSIRKQGAETIPEVVVCDDSRGTVRPRTVLNLLGIPDSTTLHGDNCDIYVRPQH